MRFCVVVFSVFGSINVDIVVDCFVLIFLVVDFVMYIFVNVPSVDGCVVVKMFVVVPSVDESMGFFVYIPSVCFVVVFPIISKINIGYL
jgi:hypothetical protein